MKPSTFALALVLMFFLGCTHSAQYSVEIKRGVSVEDRLQLASRLIEPAEAAKVRRLVKEKVDGATDEDMASLTFGVKKITLDAEEHVLVVLTISGAPSSRSRAILKAAADALEERLKSV